MKRAWPFNWIQWVTLGLIIALTAVTLIGSYYLHKDGERAFEAHRALCLIKADDAQNIKTTKKFLREHPAGIPGVPNALLEKGLQSREQELRALKDVSC